MNKPHKHADLIKDWADGFEIEWYRENLDQWVHKTDCCWYEDVRYRVKPSQPDFGGYVTSTATDFAQWSQPNLARFAQDAVAKLAERENQLERADSQFKEVVQIADELAEILARLKNNNK